MTTVLHNTILQPSISSQAPSLRCWRLCWGAIPLNRLLHNFLSLDRIIKSMMMCHQKNHTFCGLQRFKALCGELIAKRGNFRSARTSCLGSSCWQYWYLGSIRPTQDKSTMAFCRFLAFYCNNTSPDPVEVRATDWSITSTTRCCKWFRALPTERVTCLIFSPRQICVLSRSCKDYKAGFGAKRLKYCTIKNQYGGGPVPQKFPGITAAQQRTNLDVYIQDG